jgi:L-ascorbate metabolism protein UlaG (beta-lactamase superfamily)
MAAVTSQDRWIRLPGIWSEPAALDGADAVLVTHEHSVYHPGDALQVPAGPVETLPVPAHGSWMKLCEAIDFVRAVRPARAFPIHDGQLNERGMGSVNACSPARVARSTAGWPPARR